MHALRIAELALAATIAACLAACAEVPPGCQSDDECLVGERCTRGACFFVHRPDAGRADAGDADADDGG